MNSNVQMWALIVGTISPNLIALVQQPNWSSQARSWATAACALALSVPTVAVAGDLTGKSVTTAALLIGVTSISTYQHLWKHTGLPQAIESASSPASGKHARHDDDVPAAA